MFCTFLKNGLVYNNNSTQITVAPCCYYSSTFPLTDQHTIDHYRKIWLESDVNQTCRRCIDMENQGIASYRQASFDMTPNTSNNIEMLTVAVNKQCNLACASCDAGSSSFWYQENLRGGIELPIEIHNLHREDRLKDTTQKFVKILSQQNLSDLKYIKFGGGEPMMSNVHLEIMKLIPSPDQVTIQYTTNFSIMPKHQVFEQWQQFKLIKWVASLDGTQDQFNLLRWPYKWDQLSKFAKEAIETAPDNVMFGVEHTLNPLNIYYYDRFKEWFNNDFFVNRYGDPTDLNLHACRGKLGIEHTPPRVRDMVKRKYGLDHSLSRMLDDNPWSGSTTQLTQYLDRLDRSRNQNWRTVFAEIEQYFD